MKHCRKRLILAFSSALLVLPGFLRADVVIMKDSKKYENAKVLSETAETITFEYIVVGTIKDTRTEPKSAVAQVIRQKPEEIEILPLRKLLPTADLLTADKYESIIQDQMKPFVTKYAGTPQAAEVEGMIKTLQEEKEKVIAGSLKMEGQWLTSDAVKRDAHSIDAYRVRRDIKDLAAEGKYREALTEWQKMSNTNDGYVDTLQYVKTIPEVVEILKAYKKQLDRMTLEQPSLQKRRDDSVSKMLPSDPILARTKRAIDAEVLAFKTETDVAKKSHERWLPIYKYDIKSLQAANKIVIDEMARLNLIDINKLNTQNEAFVAASRAIAGGDPDLAEAAIQRGTLVGGPGSSSKSVQAMRAAIAALKKEAAMKRSAQRVYGNGKVNAVSTSTVGTTDSRVEDAIAKADADAAAKKAAKDGAATEKPETPADDGASSPAKTTTPKKDSTTRQKEKDKEKKKHTASATAPAPAPAAEEEGGIQKYLLMGGGGLLAVLVTVVFLQKRKQQNT